MGRANKRRKHSVSEENEDVLSSKPEPTARPVWPAQSRQRPQQKGDVEVPQQAPQAQVFYPPQWSTHPNGFYPNGGGQQDLSATVAILKTEVSGIKQTVADLGATVTQAIGNLTAKVDQKGQINWSVLGMIFSFIVSGLIYFSNANLRPLENDVRRLDTQMAKNTDNADVRVEKMILASEARMEKQLSVLIERHKKVEDELVPFKFHQIQWASYEAQIKTVQQLLDFHRNDLQRQATANTDRLNALDANSAKNAAADSQERIRQLETQLGALRAEIAKLLPPPGKPSI